MAQLVRTFVRTDDSLMYSGTVCILFERGWGFSAPRSAV